VANLKEELASLKIDHESRASGGRRGGTILIIILLLLAAAAGGWYWTRSSRAVAVKTAVVTAATGGGGASPGAVLNASGYVTARRRATVSSKVTGKVLEVFIEEGKAVKKGQILARLDDSQIRAALAVAQAQLTTARGAAAEDEARLREAERQYGRLSQLVQEKVVGRAEVDTAQSSVESLKARIELARHQVEVAQSQVKALEVDLSDMVVRAPFDGVAISKDAQPGEMISPVSAGGGFTRTGICTIVDMSSLEIEVDVSESYINRVKADQPVEAILDAYPDWRIPAHVITTVPTADRQKATVRVRIGFEELEPRILPDMGVKVSFYNEKQAEAKPGDAPPKPRLMVPKGAVRSDGGQNIVIVVHDDRVERRAVTTGPGTSDQVEILSGLNSGEKIVVDGVSTLADGARIQER
jgi:RND family efflux transporter MFP subunit